MNEETVNLQGMDEGARALVQRLLATVEQRAAELKHKQSLLDRVNFEMALVKRLKFAAKSEVLGAEQRRLLEESFEEELQAVGEEIKQMRPAADKPARQSPKRRPLPANLPRLEICDEPHSTTCACGCQMKRIGQYVAEKLRYQPGTFSVERHVRGKWVCAQCETILQAPASAHIIDKSISTTGLLAHVLVAKYADHLPLFRQEAIYARAGVQLQPLVDALRLQVPSHAVLHADETPVQMLKPASQSGGKAHRAHLRAYPSRRHEAMKAVIYDARRKFFELHTAHKNQIAEQALQ